MERISRRDRVAVELQAETGIRHSWVMVDKLMAVRRERIKQKISQMSPEAFVAVEQAMQDVLGLIEAERTA